LSVADVVAATGLEVLEAHNEPPISCVFDLGPDGTEAIFVSLEDGEGRSIGPAAVFDSYVELVAAGDAQEISGVGEQAIFAPSYRGLVVDVGQGDFIALGVNGGYGALSEPRDVLISLARSVLSRL
jgi:hypothetical protein